jgi:predicted subunit of tRNA(5-methylaminomethyl-2-thiouridylate) methyltransferase
MSSVDGIVAAHVAMTQAQVQTEIATRLLKVALETGRPQQMLELVRQAAEAAAETIQASVADGARQLDLLA